MEFYHCSKGSYNIPSYGDTVESAFAIWYLNADNLRIRMKDMNQFALQSSLLQLPDHSAWSLCSVLSL